MIAKKILKHQPNVMSLESAKELAETLNENDLDGWTYKVQTEDGRKGVAYVATYDENGNLAGVL